MESLFCTAEAVPRNVRAQKVVVITGCDSGFGFQLATHTADVLGFNVVAACLTADGEERLQAALKFNGGTVVRADLTDPAGLNKLVVAAEKAADSAQDGGIWALVNNAGVAFPGNIEWSPPDAYVKTMAVNFHVPVNLTYALLPRIKAEKGRVLNVTSVDGFMALPSNAAYNASKHALEAYSDTLRMEMLPWGVKVVVIEPATMRTPLAMSYFDAWLKGYEAAPEERKAPYGDEWAKRFATKGSEALEKMAADPTITVDAMAEALVDPSPKIRYLTGKLAHCLFKPISCLPHALQDSLLMAMTFQGQKPAGLAPPL